MRAPGRVWGRAAAASCSAHSPPAGRPEPQVQRTADPHLVRRARPRRHRRARADLHDRRPAAPTTIQVEQLPADVDARHATLVRRLQAKDTSIDLLSLDSAFTAEFAAARFLAPVPEELEAAFSQDVAAGRARRRDVRRAARRRSVVVRSAAALVPRQRRRAGRPRHDQADQLGRPGRRRRTARRHDPDRRPGRQRTGRVGQRPGRGWRRRARRRHGSRRPGRPRLRRRPGRSLGRRVLPRRPARGPGPSTDALRSFAAPDGGFLLASELGHRRPRRSRRWRPTWAGRPTPRSATPASPRCPASVSRCRCTPRAPTCPTTRSAASPRRPSLQLVMASTGHSASRLTTYDDPAVKRVLSAWPSVTRPAVQSGTTVPVTPYWQVVQSAIDDTWRPLRGLRAGHDARALAEGRPAPRSPGSCP